MPFFIYCTKNLFWNMDIYQTAKIKIHQKITKSSTVFTNMMLHSWKKNFDYKCRYREQCFTLKVWWILLYKKVLFLNCHLFYCIDVCRNGICKILSPLLFYNFGLALYFSFLSHCVPSFYQRRWNAIIWFQNSNIYVFIHKFLKNNLFFIQT